MIKSFANSKTERLFRTGTSKFPKGLDARRALVLLRMLDAAPSLHTISPLKSMGLHPLKGDRQGQWAITVSGPWRICFRFADGDAHDVEIVDYHA
jgi:proteic killer suppression protein